MALYLVATPIGNNDDISLRALRILQEAEIIILEERKEGSRFLRSHAITGKEYLELNEHSSPSEILALRDLCRSKKIALITDCGTPGFADPGSELVQLCRQEKINVQTLPGASSLMALLSLSGIKLNQFLFRGFLSAETELRQSQWQELKNEKRAIILMDTPYRLQKTLKELETFLPERRNLLALNLTQESEVILEGKATEISARNPYKKAEFMLLIYPQ